jgi:5-formyltetrahydrofolate cyclo-ligase
MDIRGEDPLQAAEHFFNAIPLSQGQVIAGYWPSGSEFDVRPLLERLSEQDYKCALPVVKKDSHVLGFTQWQDDMELKRGEFDVLEPVVSKATKWLEPDIVIVPLLAFDRRGYRLGQGGGYYDATLADLRAKKAIVAVGFAYAQQACLFNLPVESHDQKLDWVITPQGAQSFNP